LYFHPLHKVLNLQCRSHRSAVTIDQSVCVDHSGVFSRIRHLFERCQQRSVRVSRNGGLVFEQRWIKRSVLVVLPNLSTDGLCLRYRHWILEATQTIDKTILTIHPHSELDDAVIIP
jgi:hypothetical protein